MADTNEERTRHLRSDQEASNSSAEIIKVLTEVRKEVADLRTEVTELREFVDARFIKPTQPLGETIEEIRVGVRDANSKIEEVKVTVNKIDRTISILSRDILDVRADVTSHENRISNIEARH
jgi:chromosome segregation ATPase